MTCQPLCTCCTLPGQARILANSSHGTSPPYWDSEASLIAAPRHVSPCFVEPFRNVAIIVWGNAAVLGCARKLWAVPNTEAASLPDLILPPPEGIGREGPVPVRGEAQRLWHRGVMHKMACSFGVAKAEALLPIMEGLTSVGRRVVSISKGQCHAH
eukprot:CAMPEP_0171113732 /NCGR_PEP_ID=MMETSP0766_2-20121228/83409_1 /TAXON_ID=439317 /ORGANISM="Gambierdiscus australes, Strain CAWD 149" /LENGTH=155 /DNA_ID=CAMNT_0011575973 /DNA_START=481 /DNA_END=946 /DNA_ORIENTATION=+